MNNIVEKLVSAKLARRNYDLGKLAEEYILEEAKKFFADSKYVVHYQFETVIEVKPQSSRLICSAFKVSSRKRKYDIAIENTETGKIHVIEIKHQIAGGTAIDSVAIHLEDKPHLVEVKKNTDPFSLIVADFLPNIEYNDNWKKKEKFTENSKVVSRFNDFAINHNILVLLISEPDESLNLYFKEVLKTLC